MNEKQLWSVICNYYDAGILWPSLVKTEVLGIYDTEDEAKKYASLFILGNLSQILHSEYAARIRPELEELAQSESWDELRRAYYRQADEWNEVGADEAKENEPRHYLACGFQAVTYYSSHKNV